MLFPSVPETQSKFCFPKYSVTDQGVKLTRNAQGETKRDERETDVTMGLAVETLAVATTSLGNALGQRKERRGRGNAAVRGKRRKDS